MPKLKKGIFSQQNSKSNNLRDCYGPVTHKITKCILLWQNSINRQEHRIIPKGTIF